MFAKKPALTIFVLCLWAILIYFAYQQKIKLVSLYDPVLTMLGWINAIIWLVTLLCSLHYLSYQIFALFRKSPTPKLRKDYFFPDVAILYTTCNDFEEDCCLSCLQQDYPGNFHLYICDDSDLPDECNKVILFCHHHPEVTHLIRPNHKGFKAGNLNHALRTFVHEKWFLLVDADQRLDDTYLLNLVTHIPENCENLAFLQASSETYSSKGNSSFQRNMAPEIALFYTRDLPEHQTYGFMPMFGHGTLIQTMVWQQVGGFPEIVSEDFGFALRASAQGLQGLFVESVMSREVYPTDFGGFMIRICKYAGGAAELIRQEGMAFLKGQATTIEKYDLVLRIVWYILMPLMVINGFISEYVAYRLTQHDIPYLYPALPYVYSFMFLSALALNLSVTQKFGSLINFYFWAIAIYTAAAPLAGWEFIRCLFSKPVFKRTPKQKRVTPVGRLNSAFMILIGIAALTCIYLWPSPFWPFLFGQGLAYCCFPLYGKINNHSFLGLVSKVLIIAPGFFMIGALITMWLNTWF